MKVLRPKNNPQVANVQIHQKEGVWYSDKQTRYHYCSLQLPSLASLYGVLLLPADVTLQQTVFLIRPDIVICHTPPVTSGHLMLTKSPQYSSARNPEYIEYPPIFALVYSFTPPVPKVHCCDLATIWLESESFPCHLPEQANPSHSLREYHC